MTTELKEKLQQPKEEFTSIVNSVFTGKATLSDCYSILHQYSLQNTLFAIAQLRALKKPISPIATYNKWKSLKRQVNKGEQAIWIQYPCTKSIYVKDEETNETKKIQIPNGHYYWKKSHFACSQTTGKDISNELGIFSKQYNLNELLNKFGITYKEFNRVNGQSMGFANDKNEIRINPIDEYPIHTLFHEISHITCNHLKEKTEYNQAEIEAELSAYILCDILKVEPKGQSDSRGYIKHYLEGKTEIDKETSKKVINNVNEIINILKGKKELK